VAVLDWSAGCNSTPDLGFAPPVQRGTKISVTVMNYHRRRRQSSSSFIVIIITALHHIILLCCMQSLTTKPCSYHLRLQSMHRVS